MEDKTQLPEHIKEMLKDVAIKYDKPLDDVIADYKKFLQENEKELYTLYNLWKLAKLKGDDPFQAIQEALKKPDYKKATALYDYDYIKKDDTLIFNMDSKELKDGKIYLLNLKLLSKNVLLCGEYNQKQNCFIISDREKKALENDSTIEVLGTLINVMQNIN